MMNDPNHQHEIVELADEAPIDLGACYSCCGPARLACAVPGCDFFACIGCMTPERPGATDEQTEAA